MGFNSMIGSKFLKANFFKMKIPICNVIYFLILNYAQVNFFPNCSRNVVEKYILFFLKECYQLPTDQQYINIVDTCGKYSFNCRQNHPQFFRIISL